MKSKHGQQYQQATVWTRGDRAAKPFSQLGAQIDRVDRRSVCVYSSLWLCLSGTKAVFEQVRIVKDCMRSIINEDMLRGCGNSIMRFIHVHQRTHRELIPHICQVWATLASAYLNLLTVSHNSPYSSQNYPTTSDKKAFNLWNANAAVSVGESSGFTRRSSPGCDLVPRISSVSL